MGIIKIKSVNATELDPYLRLSEAQLRNRLDPENALFIAESPNVIRTALDSGVEAVSLFCEKSQIDGEAADIIERIGDIPVYAVDRELFASVKGFALTRGVHCAMKRPKASVPSDVLEDAKRVAVLENTVDAVNLGAIFRSAAALNIDAVLLSPSCSDPLVRRSVRVSMGTVFQIPWAFISNDLYNGGVDELHAHGFKTVAMALSKNSVWIDDDVLKKEEKLAIVLGTEGEGLKDATIDACDFVAKIPMYNSVDSLNVASAATLAFWELRVK
ncbi:MAG: RNA methyltransferase [Ruminococcaceae bacterium]|nr:RNA methyltransferase [Oscillospiraceae bacterium]